MPRAHARSLVCATSNSSSRGQEPRSAQNVEARETAAPIGKEPLLYEARLGDALLKRTWAARIRRAASLEARAGPASWTAGYGPLERVEQPVEERAVDTPGFRVATIVLIAIGAVVASASAAVVPTVAAITAAVRAQHSVHYHGVASFPGVRLRVEGDAAVGQGIQHITYMKSERTGHVTILVIANTAYVRGDAFTLMNFMGFPANGAAHYAGKWLRIDHTTRAFATVAAAVRLDSSFVRNLDIPATLRGDGATRVDGQRVLSFTARRSIQGHEVTEAIYVRAVGPPLPVEEKIGDGATFDAHYGNWNQRVHLTAPANAIAPS